MNTIVIQSVSALIIDSTRRLLLIKRKNAPYLGSWSLPGGRVEKEESFTEAVAREVYEETGLIVEIKRSLKKERVSISDDQVFEIDIYLAKAVGGSLQVGSDALEAKWVPLDELESLTLTPNLTDFLSRTLPEIATDCKYS